ncbi:hypothetical protein OCF84_21750 (plasmid) [Shewanella xiamenensis]|uniref:Uncharacterized protein n=1 Tax=Shewanella xiamenensis TaxID=332186 RepID=A0ABT6UG80_9GAMM|nr:hypothetical protein [Shewanella xiamenensis]MDI5832496.1 hypothetical protein [Shewanella xiamenensis]WHF57885.1 hypothetical protein OCF84_21750 [Shewanella xiamenensis]
MGTKSYVFVTLMTALENVSLQMLALTKKRKDFSLSESEFIGWRDKIIQILDVTGMPTFQMVFAVDVMSIDIGSIVSDVTLDMFPPADTETDLEVSYDTRKEWCIGILTRIDEFASSKD